MPDKIPEYESRDFETLKKHYEFEKKLADDLKNSDSETRHKLYQETYEKLFKNIKVEIGEPDKKWLQEILKEKADYIIPRIKQSSTILEYGAWDRSLLLELKNRCKNYLLVDFFNILDEEDKKDCVEIDGLGAKVDDSSVDLVFEYIFFHLLHQEDAQKHAEELYRMLSPKGNYISVISNSSIEPSDISRYFTDGPAEGLHLKEYSHAEVVKIFKKAGFKKFGVLLKILGKWRKIPIIFYIILDKILTSLPKSIHRKVKQISRIRTLYTIRFIATK